MKGSSKELKHTPLAESHAVHFESIQNPSSMAPNIGQQYVVLEGANETI